MRKIIIGDGEKVEQILHRAYPRASSLRARALLMPRTGHGDFTLAAGAAGRRPSGYGSHPPWPGFGRGQWSSTRFRQGAQGGTDGETRSVTGFCA